MADEATPVDFLPNLPPRTELEQLTAAYEAGLLTPALFALAKEKLLHPDAPAPVAPPTSLLPTPPAVAEGDATPLELPPLTSFFTETPPAPPTPVVAPTPVAPVPPAAAVPPPTPPPAAPDASYLFGKKIELEPVAPTFLPPAAPTPIVSQSAEAIDFLVNSVPEPLPPASPPPPRPAAVPRAVAPPASPSILPKVLLAVGILGLLLLLYWQVVGSHPDEQLTSPRPPAASETSTAPVAAKAKPRSKRTTKTSKAKKRKAKKNTQALVPADSAAATPALRASAPKRKPASSPKAAAPVEAAVASEVMPRAVPAAPEAGDTEPIVAIRTTMAGYYADMLAPPFSAAQHFAPHVQRLYIQQNLTPADIDASFNRNFFPDNKRAVLQIEPGTLRVSAPAADGTRMATFVEASRVYHPSRQAYQRLRAQVRARFDADYKLIYLRQERLLESTVEQ
ncbi:hypothetical protein GO988_06220 [Hymenobacter sp. HMF4947]|uniref:Uncharacterized protein n=1 Tax=Hymenobacter ginkgonis TaxID=2682976 RepID=A0A7K1TBY1_9BACT|nr:hypothetical protein [Hymenobacter ginkgonis]MVN75918.1 hypothetical protein [Hymenobacter ginkgonis]